MFIVYFDKETRNERKRSATWRAPVDLRAVQSFHNYALETRWNKHLKSVNQRFRNVIGSVHEV